MANNSNNDLNMILSAKVVELKVKLDAKGSNLEKQVNDISKRLKDHPVKLKVQLDASVNDLNKQINNISRKISQSKTFKPLKIDLEIDIKGSAETIKKQLKEIINAMNDFNNKYNKQLKQLENMQKNTNKSLNNGSKLNIKNDASVQGFNNIKQYVKQLEEAEAQLRGKFADGKGLFSSVEFKDAQGNLYAFTTALERADGVVEKIKYKWNQDKNQFQVIDRSTMTNTEKMVHKSMLVLQDLEREIAKTGDQAVKFREQYNQMMSSGSNGKLTMDSVMDFRTQIKNAQALVQQTKKQNDELVAQRRLMEEVRQARNKAWKATKDVNLRYEYNALLRDIKSSNGSLKEQKAILIEINNKANQRINKEKEIISLSKQKLRLEQTLKRLENEVSVKRDPRSAKLLIQARSILKTASSLRELFEVEKKLEKVKIFTIEEKNLQRKIDLIDKIKDTLWTAQMLGVKSAEEVQKEWKRVENNLYNSVGTLETMLKGLKREVKNFQDNSATELEAKRTIKTDDNFKHLVERKDLDALKEYFGTLYNGKVDIVKLKDAHDSLDRAITEIRVKMQGTGKTVEAYTLQMNNATGTLLQTTKGIEYNANRNLGVFEQLKIAMQRVPVWMASMTAFYGTIHSVQAMANQILEVDKALTELRRVASGSINIDSLFQGAVKLSGELGNNVNDVLESLNEFARTFGDFNERQLLNITKTATLMANVSDLTAQEAGDALVGTMNAFNVTAEDSIHIVDALNEVNISASSLQ